MRGSGTFQFQTKGGLGFAGGLGLVLGVAAVGELAAHWHEWTASAGHAAEMLAWVAGGIVLSLIVASAGALVWAYRAGRLGIRRYDRYAWQESHAITDGRTPASAGQVVPARGEAAFSQHRPAGQPAAVDQGQHVHFHFAEGTSPEAVREAMRAVRREG